MEASIADIRATFAGLSEAEWDELNRRLNRFFYRYYAREPRLEPGDLINSAILDVLEGRRHWPEGISLATLLCGAMRSNASHILTSRKRHPTQPIEHTPELELLKNENFGAYLQICDELRDMVRDDDWLLAELVELLIRDPKLQRGDFVEMLKDVPKKDVLNAYRRLTRLIKKLNEEWDDGKKPRTDNQAKSHLGA